MKLPTCDKQSDYGRKPLIKKGYYPGKLTKVEGYKDKDGNWREGKYGRQLIFTFAVFKPDPETNAPLEQMKFTDNSGGGASVTDIVTIPKFVYHQYKDQKTGDYRTAITPNSAITKILKALGWEFSTEDVDLDLFLDNWVELNIDDYDAKSGDETYKASTIKDINVYEGPEPSKDIKTSKAPEKKDVKKTLKHEYVKKEEAKTESSAKSPFNPIEEKKAQLLKLKNEGLITSEGYDKAIESLDVQK